MDETSTGVGETRDVGAVDGCADRVVSSGTTQADRLKIGSEVPIVTKIESKICLFIIPGTSRNRDNPTNIMGTLQY
jgi:hypothetical protein